MLSTVSYFLLRTFRNNERLNFNPHNFSDIIVFYCNHDTKGAAWTKHILV